MAVAARKPMTDKLMKPPVNTERLVLPERFAQFPATADAWTAAQRADFDTWFATVPGGATVELPNYTLAIKERWGRCVRAMTGAPS